MLARSIQAHFTAAWLLSFVVCYFMGAARVVSAESGDDLFNATGIRHLRIEIAKKDLAILRKPVSRNRVPGDRPSVPAIVREDSMVWTNVAVHLKGSYGSFRPIDEKPALTLNFDKNAPHQRFHGLQKISLNNSVQDPAYVSEKVCRELFLAAGVPMPRVDYATVELNGRKLGLYVLAEGWTKQFFKRHFNNAKGNFYDPGNKQDVNVSSEPSFGDSPDSPFTAVRVAIDEPDHVKRLQLLRESVDLDRLVSMHALDVLMWNWDGYGLGRNNFRFFHDLGANRLVIFPHGLDQMFWKPNGPIVTGRAGLVVKSLLETREGRRLYLERFRQIRTNLFDLQALTNRVTELTARIQPALANEGERRQQRGMAMRFVTLAALRARSVDAQLTSVSEFEPLELDSVRHLGRWVTSNSHGSILFAQSTNTAPPLLRLAANANASIGCWTTTIWLEEGRYRIEGRVKTAGVKRNDSDGGAGFRVWSSRKDSKGASWDWFPYRREGDSRAGGTLPTYARTREQWLNGNNRWTDVSYEFELRQPLADVQIQCGLEASDGAAWFDLGSLQIRRVAMEVTKTKGKGD